MPKCAFKDPTDKKLFIKALRDPENQKRQITGSYFETSYARQDGELVEQKNVCALGLYLELKGITSNERTWDWGDYFSVAPTQEEIERVRAEEPDADAEDVMAELAINVDKCANDIIEMNDVDRKTFAEIAEEIEKTYNV